MYTIRWQFHCSAHFAGIKLRVFVITREWFNEAFSNYPQVQLLAILLLFAKIAKIIPSKICNSCDTGMSATWHTVYWLSMT